MFGEARIVLSISPVQPDTRDIVERLLRDASAWLVNRGIDQWKEYPGLRDCIEAAMRCGTCFLAFKGQTPVATLQVDSFADPDFWTAGDQPGVALYVHRMAVDRAAAGEGLGRVLMDWAACRAAAFGKAWLRLDAQKDNLGLHQYYANLGFTRVRVVDLPHRVSGALFQRSTAKPCLGGVAGACPSHCALQGPSADWSNDGAPASSRGRTEAGLLPPLGHDEVHGPAGEAVTRASVPESGIRSG
ncbi:hypothetical protein GCM10010449_38660 [Streptomyces rectiviolaceus]|uniref:N-acetyltransferase domain-containing protein n=1 Tax=Streptomyces rectiviolaceus TaxID=332591 RepID=A0ABP6MGI7_9ACTN